MKTIVSRLLTIAVLVVVGSGCAEQDIPPSSTTVTTVTSDGVTIFGETYFDNLDANDPLILLFHQGGSNGRGEYAGIASMLNEKGYRAIAWDQRSGGDTYGESNRTIQDLADDTPSGYCDAYHDLRAALEYAVQNNLADRVIIWGSSYSAALVFRLAAEHPDKIEGVIAFSPASGGPLVDCRARMWLDDVEAETLVLRPASEMERESSIEQRDILTAAGIQFLVIENGVHGSSMLVDERTEADMSAARLTVINWMDTVVGYASR